MLLRKVKYKAEGPLILGGGSPRKGRGERPLTLRPDLVPVNMKSLRRVPIHDAALARHAGAPASLLAEVDEWAIRAKLEPHSRTTQTLSS